MGYVYTSEQKSRCVVEHLAQHQMGRFLGGAFKDPEE